jgi:hypothetical protein
MALAQLIYVSRRRMSSEALTAIVAKSTVSNARRNITGALLCSGQNLMQILEGEVADIVSRYEVIRRDGRHTDVQCLVCKNVVKRMFPDSKMMLADLDSQAVLDRQRLIEMVEGVRLITNTSHYPIEAHVLLRDFKQQLCGPGFIPRDPEEKTSHTDPTEKLREISPV